jgi:glutaredoxin-like protein DUF836
MTASNVPDLILYRRDGCELCEESRAIVQALLEDRAAHGRRTAALREVDIAADADLEAQFGTTIPVLELDGRRLELAISSVKVRRFLDEALDGALA